MSYEIEKLLPRHMRVMDLLIAGFSQRQISRELQLTPQAVCSIVHSRVFQDRLPERRRDLQRSADPPVDESGQAAHALERAALPAACKLVGLVDSEDDRVALAASIAVLDRVGCGKTADARCTVDLSAEQADLIRETLGMEEL